MYAQAYRDHAQPVTERNKSDHDSSVRTEGHGDWRVLCWIHHLVYILQCDVERLHVAWQRACLFEPLKIVTLRVFVPFTRMHRNAYTDNPIVHCP